MFETNFIPTVFLSFDGKDDYVALPAMTVDWAQGVTIEAWARFEKFNQYARIMDMANGYENGNIVLCCDNAAPHLLAQVYTAHGKPYIRKEGALELGQWAHLAMTIEPSGVGKLYKSGQLVHSGHVRLPESGHRANNWIGRSAWPQDGYFQGQLAEVRVWKVARTEAELQRDLSRKLSGSEPGLVAYLPMDEGSGEVARDRSPNGFHGTRCGASWAGTPQPPITKRLDELEAKLGACSDCASKLAEHDKQLKALEEAAKQCGACASKLVELTNAGVIAERKAAEQEQKLIELERRIAELAAKAAQCAACEDRAVVQARLIAELSARVDDLTRKLADKTEPPEPADDLQRIEGIGPKIAEELKAAGIRTLKQLAATEVAELHKILKAGGPKYARNDPASWPKQAQLLVAGKVAELTALQDSLRAGRPKP